MKFIPIGEIIVDIVVMILMDVFNKQEGDHASEVTVTWYFKLKTAFKIHINSFLEDFLTMDLLIFNNGFILLMGKRRKQYPERHSPSMAG